jgi:hypothetical protein
MIVLASGSTISLALEALGPYFGRILRNQRRRRAEPGAPMIPHLRRRYRLPFR